MVMYNLFRCIDY